MRNRCGWLVLVLAYSGLFLPSDVAAQVGEDGRVHFSVIGSGGIDDGRNVYRTDDHTASLSSAFGPTSFRLRYPIPAEPQLNRGPGSTSHGPKYFIVRLRYRDPDGTGADSRVVLRLKSTNVYTGGVTTLLTFDSNTQPSTDYGFETVSLVDCSSPLPAFDFTFKSYWFEVEMTRASEPARPGIAGISIMIGHEWTCGL